MKSLLQQASRFVLATIFIFVETGFCVFTVVNAHSYEGTSNSDDIYFGLCTACNDGGPGLYILKKTGDTIIEDISDPGSGTLTINSGEGNDKIAAVDAGTIELENSSGKHIFSFGPFVGLGFTAIELNGGNGDDTITGSPLNDAISGGSGQDVLSGGSGDDTIQGGDGNDRIIGNAGNDHLYGNAGDDFISGWDGNDHLYGGIGNDYLCGSQDNDVLWGDEDNDILLGGIGLDDIDGGPGEDRFYCRSDLNAIPVYDNDPDIETDCADTGHYRRNVETQISNDPYTQWTPMWFWGKGIRYAFETTSSHALVLSDDAAGAVILLDAVGYPLHTTHKQYPDTCGPTALNMVMAQLGRTDRSRSLFMPVGLDDPAIPRTGFGPDTVDVGHWLSMEHIMYEGYHQYRILDPTWQEDDYLSSGGLLNISPADLTRLGYYQFDYPLIRGVEDWMQTGPAVGTSGKSDVAERAIRGLAWVANKFANGSPDANPVSITFGSDGNFTGLDHLKAVIKGYVDHDIPLVVGVENGGHFNTLMGYWEALDHFYIYLADPLDGYGRPFYGKPMRWRRLDLTENAITSGEFVSLLLYGHSDAAWAADIDTAYGSDTLTGYVSGLPNFNPYYIEFPDRIAIPEGTRLTFPADPVYGGIHRAQDPEGNTMYYRWDFDGDAFYDDEGTTVAHTWPDNGTSIVTVGAWDGDRTTVEGTKCAGIRAFQVDTYNVPPRVIIWSPESVLNWTSVGYDFTFHMGISDPGGRNDEPYAIIIDWGDGHGTTGDSLLLGTTERYYACKDTEQTYTLTLDARDKDGSGDSESVTFTVPSIESYNKEKLRILTFQYEAMRFKEIHEGLKELQLMDPVFMTRDLPEIPMVLVFRAAVQPDASILLKPFFMTTAAASQASVEWTHTLAGLDKNNTALINLNLTLPPPDGSVKLTSLTQAVSPADTVPFVAAMAWQEGIHTIELQDRQGKVIAQRSVSPSSPQIQLLTPLGGETILPGDDIFVSWFASDADSGDQLTFCLALSRDNINWFPVTMDLSGTDYVFLNTKTLAQGRYWIKIIASDGILSAEAVSKHPVILSATAITPSLSGRVMDPYGEPFNDAIVQVLGTQMTAKTDALGKFSIGLDNTPSGRYEVVVSGKGLATIRSYIHIDKASESVMADFKTTRAVTDPYEIAENLRQDLKEKETLLEALNQTLSTLYTADQLQAAIDKALENFDVGGDRKMGFPEITRTLQMLSGMRE
ncbi:carboxypeptidase regulatory-like domain-containing protein [Desulfobacula sp.]|uniref:carboxypeptidase regulatory-like domain-containing protein n=1 Tax=Desulfobacula sp. TaxID=2593537 RepID=UPI00261C8647|nr:carboxypeptidase regulatory-like domain-containing protein [Desulfobacula sp.]